MKHPSRIFFAVMMMLCLIGLFFVFEASMAEAFTEFGNRWKFVKMQSIWLSIGLLIFFISSRIPLQVIRVGAYVLFPISMIFMVLVLIPGIGMEVQGARRWIGIGLLRFQPVEVLKASMIFFFSHWLSRHQRARPFFFLMAIFFGLIMLQPDLGSALIVGSIGTTMYITAGGRWRHLAYFAGLGVLAVALVIIFSPFRRNRIRTFLDPDSDPLGRSYQIRQITIALGRGAWFGQGIGQSRQRFQYIPEASTDSIYAIIAEEIGLMGGLLIFALFAILIHMGFVIARSQHSGYEQLMASGIVAWIASQTMVNLASVVALVPLTGVPLPFISYGGSSLVILLAMSGILVGMGRKI